MFGYVGPAKSELKVRELSLYQAYYCGLCRCIGERCSQPARLCLSYDCAFLAILLSGLGECAGCGEGRCAFKAPWKKRPVARMTEQMEFAADLNVLLSYYKCRDDWRDERKAAGYAGTLFFADAQRRAARRRPALAARLAQGLETLGRVEQNHDPDTVLDEASDAFASMMRACMEAAPIADAARKTVAALMYHLGKWIYLMDAWDDRAKDAKSGAFNPFAAAGAGKERAAFLIHASLNEAIKAYGLLHIVSAKGILDNIFYEGCVGRTKRLLEAGGGYEQ